MRTPFGPPLDIQKLKSYTEIHTPNQMVLDAHTWPCDPTDILETQTI